MWVAAQSITAGDLCCQAAEQLLSAKLSRREEIEAVIMVTQTPDYFMPATAAIIHGKVRLPTECAAFDVNLGSSGYVYGLWLAFQMVETRSAKTVLLLAGDTLDRLASPRAQGDGRVVRRCRIRDHHRAYRTCWPKLFLRRHRTGRDIGT
jgi:3-oxoacyl-[acyl-carrier-protein] synthase-3